MSYWRIGIDLGSMPMSFREALRTAARAGLDAVEIEACGSFHPKELTRTAVREIRTLLEASNLRVCALTLRTQRGLAEPTNLERRLELTKIAMRAAFDLGARILVVQSGALANETDPARGLLLDVLKDLGRHGERVGAQLALQTGADNGPNMAKILSALPEGSVGVAFNPAELILHGHCPREALDALGPWVVYVHLADAVAQSAARTGHRVEFGTGAVDWPSLITGLQGLGYHGFLTLQLCGSERPESEMARALAQVPKG